MNNIIEEVKEFVKRECQKPTSKYGFQPLNKFTHILDKI